MRPLSLRNRLVVGVVSLLAIGLVVAHLASVLLFKSFQLQQVDDQLRAPFGAKPPQQVQDQMAQACTASQTDDLPQLPTSFTIITFDSAGTLTCQLPRTSEGTIDTRSLTLDRLVSTANTQELIDLGAGQGTPPTWRARVIPFDKGYAVLAASLTDVNEAVRRLVLISLTVGLIILAIATVAGIAVVRIGLRPLTAIEHTAEEIADGNISRRIDVRSDKTEVGRLGTSLNGMLTQIEAAFAERDQTEARLRRFVADASHELRTPLATIRGHAELVRKGVASGPEDVQRVVGRIESESIRMSTLVDDLLLLARLDSTRVLEQRPVDLLSITVDVVTDARVRAPQRKISVSNPTETPWLDLPPTAMGDSVRLQQILTNLLTNAVKHTPPDTPIEVEVGGIGTSVHVAVIDHGPGLQVGNEERVFERFFREDPGRTRGSGGAGLGLAIAHTLAEKHGGTLVYRPTAGGGSTFDLVLPLVKI
jgi:two-component system OmpR family sensor kinase